MTNLWAFLHQTLAASVTALFLLAIQRLFRDKLSPRWQYGVWVVLLLRLLIPVGLPGRTTLGDLSQWVELARLWAEQGLDSAFSAPWTSSRPIAPIPWWNGAAPASVTDVLFLVYLAGVVLTFLWFLASWLRLGRLLRGR